MDPLAVLHIRECCHAVNVCESVCVCVRERESACVYVMVGKGEGREKRDYTGQDTRMLLSFCILWRE